MEHVGLASLCPGTELIPFINGPSETARQSCDRLLNDAENVLKKASNQLRAVLSSTTDTHQKIVLELLCPTITQLTPTDPMKYNSQGNEAHNVIVAIVWNLLGDFMAKETLQIQSLEDFANTVNAAASFEKDCSDVRRKVL